MNDYELPFHIDINWNVRQHISCFVILLLLLKLFMLYLDKLCNPSSVLPYEKIYKIK